MRLSVCASCVLDAHLNALGESRVRVPELGAAHRQWRAQSSAGRESPEVRCARGRGLGVAEKAQPLL